MSFNPNDRLGFIYLSPIDDNIRDSQGNIITSMQKMEDSTTFENAYVRTTNWGLVRILEIKYTYETEDQQRNFIIDAGDFVKAILKDAFDDNPGIRIMCQLP